MPILLLQRRFSPFFFTQFLGAFNDNIFRNALLIMIVFMSAPHHVNLLTNLAVGLFTLPFFLFSATAGQLADRYEKATLIRYIKLLEIIIMIGAGVGFIMGNIPLLIGLLFLMGTQSTLFGPVKYGILPQHLTDHELVGGNGWVQMGTFVAILLGTIAGGILIEQGEGRVEVSTLLLAVAMLGFTSCLFIPSAKPADPTLKINPNPITETWKIIRYASENKTVFWSILAVSWFWALGTTYLTQFPNYTKTILFGNEQVVTLLLTLFSIGVGIGSLLCSRLARMQVELSIVVLGIIGLTGFGIHLYFAVPVFTGEEPLAGAREFLSHSNHWLICMDIVMLGLFGGFYIVPLYALIQQRSVASRLSRIVAANNIFNSLMMVIATLSSMVLLSNDVTIPQLFLGVSSCTALVGLVLINRVPEFWQHFVKWLKRDKSSPVKE